MVKPFRSSVMPEAPIAMHGRSVTVHVTSPTSLLLSLIVRVVEMVPLISAAQAFTAMTRAGRRIMKRVITSSVPVRVLSPREGRQQGFRRAGQLQLLLQVVNCRRFG